jgi:hypothetical protein
MGRWHHSAIPNSTKVHVVVKMALNLALLVLNEKLVLTVNRVKALVVLFTLNHAKILKQ